ncbi:MAG TPA: MerR family transcriptional regulator [Desulfobacterales bacterium]|nr:MerR family transcriptional regulator [Desulfobacterales bacterium]
MVEIPKDKRYFRIGEASRIVGVEPYVLRYWETEFPQIRPKRASSRQRTYERKDLEIILEIKRLLYEERLTIEGARKKLQQSRVKYSCNTQMILNEIKVELENILRALSSPTLP